MPPEAATILFTDVEGSTRLARALGDAWPAVVADHHALLGAAIERHGGRVERVSGDSFFALFATPSAAAAAAADAQRAIAAHPWPEPLRVRMGVHTGVVDRSAGDLTGLDIHLAARVEAAAHGGQVVLTAATRSELDGEFAIADLGEHRLKDFPAAERLFLLVHDGRGPDAFPPLGTEPVRPTNLPVQQRPLLGREAQLDALWDALGSGDDRLVTVLGLGGTGKTRLAVATAEGLLETFEGGVWLVPLAGVADASAIVPAIAMALDVPDTGDEPLGDALVARLRRKPALLVLDNVEQLVRDAGPVIADLLDRAPGTRMLATSQLPLRVRAERVFPLGPLSLPAATALFADRAGAVDPGFDAEAQAGVIEAICRRLDGSPLAVELAAARVATLSPDALLDRLDDALGVLARGPLDLPERQRSLRATLEWAHALLDDDERALFARLAVFVGPAPLDAIEAVAGSGATLDALSGLIDASLVRREESREHGVRYAMPDAVRAFALEWLGASGHERDARCAHAAHIAEGAEAYSILHAGARSSDRRRVHALAGEQRSALAWTRDHAPELHLRLASALATVMSREGRTREARAEIAVVLERFPITTPEAGWAALSCAWAAWSLGEGQDEDLMWSGLAAVRAGGDEARLGGALRMVCVMRANVGDPESVLELGDEMIDVQRRRGDPGALASALMVHAGTLLGVERFAEARKLLDEAAIIADELGDPALTVATITGDMELELGNWAAAARDYAASARAADLRDCTEQFAVDLDCLVLALVPLGADEGAIEIAALSSAIKAASGETGLETTFLADRWNEALASAWATAGPDRGAAAAARGRAIPRHERAARVTALAEAGAARSAAPT